METYELLRHDDGYDVCFNDASPTWLKFTRPVRWVWLLLRQAIAERVCAIKGCDWDPNVTGWAGPDSGGEEALCRRCGYHFHHIYY